ncbi:unknown [Clostridium sp. CAG:306]|nr:unknown [Clostridium sp. CAG:306]
MWLIKTVWNILIFLIIAFIFSFEPFNFDKIIDITIKIVLVFLFVIVIGLEIKDWKSRNKK